MTVLLHPGDNWMLHVAAEQIQPGDVVVAAVTSECSDGFFGELLASSFRARGAVGNRSVVDESRRLVLPYALESDLHSRPPLFADIKRQR